MLCQRYRGYAVMVERQRSPHQRHCEHHQRGAGDPQDVVFLGACLHTLAIVRCAALEEHHTTGYTVDCILPPIHKGIRLRLRLYLMILPLVMAAISLSGVLASLESRVALTRLANRLMAFTAEQLQNYFESEWKVVEQLGLAKDPAYQAAVEASLRSYAVSLLRSETEMIVAFDNQGTTVMQIGFQTLSSGNALQQHSAEAVKLAPGWFTRNLLGEDRVGVAFSLEPLGWTAAVTELEPAFFSDVRTMQFEQLSILIGSVVMAAFFLSIFIGHILRPAERLTATIERITVTNDLTSRAEIEFADEIGTLAREFNTMVSNLQDIRHTSARLGRLLV
jgi:adenylate cyclase